eukprot:gb/GFBE01001250.1/.p1 GENE.gb/GFBE01001250.1/~~gb/GFBE01001250.1/.p1  ORF type:complete len:175 (+),score=19.98 gb/GFBE01001250.1/:1-525(+)
MSDKKWGFESNYGHRHVPFKWHSSSGFNYYEHDPLSKKSFRPAHIPVNREDFLPTTTHYGERSQDARWAMSSYGCHRNLDWDSSLRMPRNPFPGKPSREMTYCQEKTPCASAIQSVATTRVGTPRRVGNVSMTPRGYGRMRQLPPDYALIKDDMALRNAERSHGSSFAKWEGPP